MSAPRVYARIGHPRPPWCTRVCGCDQSCASLLKPSAVREHSRGGIAGGGWRDCCPLDALTKGAEVMTQAMVFALVIVGTVFTQAVDMSPARRLSGTLPPPAPLDTIGGSSEVVQLDVDTLGEVSHVTQLQGDGGSSRL